VIDPNRWTLLIDRYLSGECSEEEQSELTHLLGADPDFRAYFLKMASMRQVGISLPASNVERALARVKTELRHAGRSSVRVSAPSRFAHIVPARHGWRFLRLAAAIVVAVLSVPLGRFALHRLEDSRVRVVEFATTAGQQSRITLPDGSRVVLAPQSHLVYSASDRGHRSLVLSGEAYFDVVHNAERRFLVHARNAVVEDIGTRFVVRAYLTDSVVRVAVAEGSVALGDSAAASRAALGAGMVGDVGRDGRPSLMGAADRDALFAWQDGRLLFNRRPLSEVLRDLERWYDLRIALADTGLASIRVSGSLPGTSVTDALDAVAAIATVRVERHGRDITIRPLRHSSTGKP
jgi:ferric-dicitrate binding protein FerR (iron transport regulator)